jgi:NAD(P) transhydrogenase subunit beta
MALAVAATLYGPGLGLWWLSVALIAAAGHRLDRRAARPDDRDAAAGGRDAQPGRPGGGVHRLQHPYRDGTRDGGMDEAARAALDGFAAVVAHKTGVEVSILRVETFLGVFIGAVTFTGSVIAFGKLAGKVDGKAKKLPGGHLLNASAAIISIVLAGGLPAVGVTLALIGMTLAALLHRLSPDHGDRRGGHAGRGVDAEQLFRLGGGGDRVLVVERPADRRRRAGGLLGCDPELHHVQGDEPVVHLGHPGRLWRHHGPAMEVTGEQIAIDAEGVAAALNDADRSSSSRATAWRWRRRSSRCRN